MSVLNLHRLYLCVYLTYTGSTYVCTQLTVVVLISGCDFYLCLHLTYAGSTYPELMYIVRTR